MYVAQMGSFTEEKQYFYFRVETMDFEHVQFVSMVFAKTEQKKQKLVIYAYIFHYRTILTFAKAADL